MPLGSDMLGRCDMTGVLRQEGKQDGLCGVVFNLFFLIAWIRFMQHLSSLGILGIKDALSAGPDFLGAVGILLATTHERADFNSRR